MTYNNFLCILAVSPLEIKVIEMRIKKKILWYTCSPWLGDSMYIVQMLHLSFFYTKRLIITSAWLWMGIAIDIYWGPDEG